MRFHNFLRHKQVPSPLACLLLRKVYILAFGSTFPPKVSLSRQKGSAPTGMPALCSLVVQLEQLGNARGHLKLREEIRARHPSPAPRFPPVRCAEFLLQF